MGGRWLIRYIFKHLKFSRPQPVFNFHWLLNWYLLFFTQCFNLFIFNLRIIGLQHFVGYCLTSTWISHRYIYVLCGSAGKELPAMWETWVQSLGWGDPLEKRKATHSSILAWRIPWTIYSMGLQRVRHNWATFTSLTLKPPFHLSLHPTRLGYHRAPDFSLSIIQKISTGYPILYMAMCMFQWTYLQGSSLNADVENRLVGIGGEGEVGMNWESSIE